MPPIHPYLDPVLPPEQRAEDLLSRMSLEDKAGQLFHSQIVMGPGGTLADADPAFGLPSSSDRCIRGVRTPWLSTPFPESEARMRLS